MRNAVILITLLVCFGSCVKNPLTTISFRGITETDPSGVIIANDPTDWTFNDSWSPKEAALFTYAYQQACSAAGNYKIIAYPNPCNGIFALHVQMPPSAKLEVRLVNNSFTVLASNDDITSNAVQLTAGAGTKGMVRLYYKLIDAACEYRGHGDILVR